MPSLAPPCGYIHLCVDTTVWMRPWSHARHMRGGLWKPAAALQCERVAPADGGRGRSAALWPWFCFVASEVGVGRCTALSRIRSCRVPHSQGVRSAGPGHGESASAASCGSTAVTPIVPISVGIGNGRPVPLFCRTPNGCGWQGLLAALFELLLPLLGVGGCGGVMLMWRRRCGCVVQGGDAVGGPVRRGPPPRSRLLPRARVHASRPPLTPRHRVTAATCSCGAAHALHCDQDPAQQRGAAGCARRTRRPAHAWAGVTASDGG